MPELEEAKKDPADVTNSYLNVDDGGSVASSAPDGVKKAQATTIVWTRKALIIAYGLYGILRPIYNSSTDAAAGSSWSSS